MHLSNCHGEWTMLALCFVQVPIVGLWVRSLFVRGSE